GDKSFHVRVGSAMALGKSDDLPEEAFAELAKALRDPSAHVRIAAAGALARQKGRAEAFFLKWISALGASSAEREKPRESPDSP
ncbi:MAG: HEAT repeat domain-containing protein, partial [Chloroflexota bacterium]